jgi:hypothetical protein
VSNEDGEKDLLYSNQSLMEVKIPHLRFWACKRRYKFSISHRRGRRQELVWYWKILEIKIANI